MYRKGVSVFILNNKKEFILVSATGKSNYWKIPAGGVENNETEEDTIQREVKEELGIEMKSLSKSKYIDKFDWPNEIRQQKFKETRIYYEGQERSVFFAKIKQNQKFKLQKKEICDYKWVNKDNYQQYIIIPSQLKFMEKIIAKNKTFF
ncbi:MAG: NUDIX hydrolase [archaeon]